MYATYTVEECSNDYAGIKLVASSFQHAAELYCDLSYEPDEIASPIKLKVSNELARYSDSDGDSSTLSEFQVFYVNLEIEYKFVATLDKSDHVQDDPAE